MTDKDGYSTIIDQAISDLQLLKRLSLSGSMKDHNTLTSVCQLADDLKEKVIAHATTVHSHPVLFGGK